MAAQTAELSRRIFEDVWNGKNLNAIDDLMSADYVHHDAGAIAANGPEGYKQFVKSYMNAFPDAHFTIDDEFRVGENEVTRWSIVGTHEGELAGIPSTGRRISITGISILSRYFKLAPQGWRHWDLSPSRVRWPQLVLLRDH